MANNIGFSGQNMLRYLISLIFVLVASVSFAQTRTFGSPAEARKLADSIMSNVGRGKYDVAWKEMRPAAIVPPTEFDAFTAQFASQQSTLALRYGKPTGFEFIRDQQVGASLLKLQYIAKFERAAMRWIFLFYRTEKGWVLTDFKFDGNTLALFAPEG
jgi:hypothetical protein